VKSLAAAILATKKEMVEFVGPLIAKIIRARRKLGGLIYLGKMANPELTGWNKGKNKRLLPQRYVGLKRGKNVLLKLVRERASEEA